MKKGGLMKNDEYLKNEGQSRINSDITDFCRQIGDIKTIKDLKKVDRAIVDYLSFDSTTPKFSRSVIDIFESKTYSGCSDVGLFVSAILREKGIPTVFVETANVHWLKAEREESSKQRPMQGHIFLEVLIGDKWYLYDPTHRCYYLNYNRNNDNYPNNYYVFSKNLNCNNHGVLNVEDEKREALEKLKKFNADTYVEPDYKKVSLKN